MLKDHGGLPLLFTFLALLSALAACADDGASSSRLTRTSPQGGRGTPANDALSNPPPSEDAGPRSRPRTPAPEPTSDTDPQSAPDGSVTGPGGPNGSSGTDAGTTGGSSAGDGFFPTTQAYAATVGPSATNTSHRFRGFSGGNPGGRACLSCHGNAFAMGGTVYADSAGTTPAAQVEVRVNNPDGTSVRAYTDAAGNFYLPTGSGNLATGAKVGMRTASGSHIMKGPATGDCNGCHRAGGSPGVLHF